MQRQESGLARNDRFSCGMAARPAGLNIKFPFLWRCPVVEWGKTGKEECFVKPVGIFLIALCLLLSGCGKRAPEETAAPAAAPTTAPAALSRETVRKNRMAVYRETVENFAFEHVFPDGSTVPVDSAFGAMEGNYFALADVDGDGEEELLISFSTGPTVSMELYVCGYDEETGNVTVKLTEFPGVTFYPGGFAAAALSHNQGLAGDALWPYVLYAYEKGSFERTAVVDAWDISMAEQDDAGNLFPAGKDMDGDGIVYLVTQNGRTEVLDGGDYNSWRASLFDPEQPQTVDYRAVTRDNIRQAFQE